MKVTPEDIAAFKTEFYFNAGDETDDPVEIGLNAVFALRDAAQPEMPAGYIGTVGEIIGDTADHHRVAPAPQDHVTGSVRYEYDPIAGKMRYFGSAAPNGWLGDDSEKTNLDDWFGQVVSFFVKHDMLDARAEYDISDVMGALQDNYEPALVKAAEGIADDYMTSETHHPGWVLIPQAKFNAICAALAATEGSADV